MSASESVELDELRQATEQLQEHTKDFVSEYDKPLKIKDGQIVQGVYWIQGPFVQDFWSKANVKPKPAKCYCPECGKSHTRKERP